VARTQKYRCFVKAVTLVSLHKKTWGQRRRIILIFTNDKTSYYKTPIMRLCAIVSLKQNYMVIEACFPSPCSPKLSHKRHDLREKFINPWCRVLLEKLTGLQVAKKFSPFHGTRRFITALTCVRQLSLSWASPIQSIYPHPTSCRCILILSTHLRLGLPRL